MADGPKRLGGASVWWRLTFAQMLLRVSAKFRKHYRCALPEGEVVPPPFPGVLNLDLVPNGRSQYLVFANEEQSLYFFCLGVGRGRDIAPLLAILRQRMATLLEEHKLPRHLWPDLENFTFASRINQR